MFKLTTTCFQELNGQVPWSCNWW